MCTSRDVLATSTQPPLPPLPLAELFTQVKLSESALLEGCRTCSATCVPPVLDGASRPAGAALGRNVA